MATFVEPTAGKEADGACLSPKDTPQTGRPRRGVPACLHCGASSPSGDFCCSGCAYVYRMINQEGLGAYYQIKDKVTVPADTALLPLRDYAWLTALQFEAEQTAAGHTPELRLDIQGISCGGCVWLIERLFNKQEGAGRIDINAQTGQLRLAWMRGKFDCAVFARVLQGFNYLVAPASAARSAPSESFALGKRVGLCTAFAMNVMLFTLPAYFGMEASFAYARLFSLLSLGFATLSLLVGGGYFFNRALRSMREGVMSIDLPIALGIAGAYGGSLAGWLTGHEGLVYFDFVASFILLMLIGRWAQVAAVERNQRRLLAQQPTPPRVRVWDESGRTFEKAPEELNPGDVFAVGPSQTVPVEARLQTERADLSLAWINGESQPRLFQFGQLVPAGAITLTRGETKFRAVQSWKGSLLAELVRPATRAEFRHRFVEKIVKGYLVGVMLVSVAAGVGWWIHSHDVVKTWSVVTAVLVVSCPCAIGLAFPLADEIATVTLRKRGVFVRTGDLWPRLAQVRRLIFDKTGTLTLENPRLQNPQAIDSLSESARQSLRCLVSGNPHPVGRCLHEHLLDLATPVGLLEAAVEEVAGFGVSVHRAGQLWTLGRTGWRGGIATTSPTEETDPTLFGETEFSCDGEVIARFAFVETVRADAKVELERLAQRGLAVVILSGDHGEKVKSLTRVLGLPEEAGLADLTPSAKARWVEENEPGRALMLGDGANDSLAFDKALCRGTPVVHRGVLEEKADFYYLGHGIGGIRALFEVNDARRSTQSWLLVFSVAYNLFAVGLAVAGHMNPLLAALIMPGSSLVSLGIVGVGMRRLAQAAAWSDR